VKVSVEKLEGSKVSLEIEVPRQAVDEALEKAFKKLVRQVNIPGWRRGKAPRSVFERYYGKAALLEEALKDTLPREYLNAVKEANVEPVDEPEFQEPQVDENGLRFKAVVYVKPEVRLENYEDIAVPFEAQEVTEEDVSRQVELLRERMAELVPLPEDASIEKGNFATVHVKRINSGDTKSEVDQDLNYVEAGREYAIIPGLGEALVGMKKGEVKELISTYWLKEREETKEPVEARAAEEAQEAQETQETQETKELALPEPSGESEKPGEPEETRKSEGSAESSPEGPEEPETGAKLHETGKTIEVRYQIEVKEAYEKRVPSPDEELAKNLGKTSMDEVKEDVKKSLTALRMRMAREQHLDKVESQILNYATVEIPRAMIERRVQELFDSLQRRLSENQMTVERYLAVSNKTIEELREEIEKDAERDVKRDLVLDAIAEKERIEVPEENVDKVMEALAKQMGQDAKAVKTTLGLRGALEDVRRQLRRQEVLSKLAQRAAERANTPLPSPEEPIAEAEEEKAEEEEQEGSKGENPGSLLGESSEATEKTGGVQGEDRKEEEAPKPSLKT